MIKDSQSQIPFLQLRYRHRCARDLYYIDDPLPHAPLELWDVVNYDKN